MGLFVDKIKVVDLFDPQTGKEIEMEEEKPYLLLLTDIDESREMDTTEGRFLATRGRQTVVNYLESEYFQIDPLFSFVMSGNIPLGKEVSVYSFLRLCIQEHKVDDISITIDELDDYARSVYPNIDLNLKYNQEINHKTRG